MLGSLILYHRGIRIMMFQLSGFYCIALALGLWVVVHCRVYDSIRSVCYSLISLIWYLC